MTILISRKITLHSNVYKFFNDTNLQAQILAKYYMHKRPYLTKILVVKCAILNINAKWTNFWTVSNLWFFQIWCGSMRDEEALEKIRTSVHSPGSIRWLFNVSHVCPLSGSTKDNSSWFIAVTLLAFKNFVAAYV